MASSPPWYAVMMVVGIGLSLLAWGRMARHDSRLPLIYLAGLVSAFIGAKLAYLLAEGWRDFSLPQTWLRLATGKASSAPWLAAMPAWNWPSAGSVTGPSRAISLLSSLRLGYSAVGLAVCSTGCCLGQVCAHETWWTLSDAAGTPRWPAVPLEIAFNLIFLVVVLTLRRRRALTGQHFHFYLISYGLFRFVHELMRDTPRVVGPLSGYALMALALAAFGGWAAWRRAHPTTRPARG